MRSPGLRFLQPGVSIYENMPTPEGVAQLAGANVALRLPPEVRQAVKTRFAVRWKRVDRHDDCSAKWSPAGEAEAVPAGEHTAKE